MKFYRWTFILSIFLCLLSSCATTKDRETPSLEDFQTQTLPTGGIDAAQTAATTY